MGSSSNSTTQSAGDPNSRVGMDPRREVVTASLQLLKARQRRGRGRGSGNRVTAASASTPTREVKLKEVVVWKCLICDQECIPVREQSRCICGHRLRDHPSKGKFSCARCTCKEFHYIVAEGAWILRCRCKHKHVDHDPNTKACKKTSCHCNNFDSPWVCNCNHAWKDHKQYIVKRRVKTLEEMTAEIGSDLCGARRENSNQNQDMRRG